jgi:hypothetical protein
MPTERHGVSLLRRQQAGCGLDVASRCGPVVHAVLPSAQHLMSPCSWPSFQCAALQPAMDADFMHDTRSNPVSDCSPAASGVSWPPCAAGRLDIFHSYCIKCHYGSEYNTWAGTDRMFRARFENVSACVVAVRRSGC